MLGTEHHRDPWRGFQGETWGQTIDVADFIRRNHTRYEGDASFLTGSTCRTLEVWTGLRRMFVGRPGDVPTARRAVTRLPDTDRRGRRIGDYRRVVLYGVDRLVEERRAHRAALDGRPDTKDVSREREESTEQIRALGELRQLATSYGHDISRPACTAREAIERLHFADVAVGKARGEETALARTAAFLDIYLQRDIAEGRLSEMGAQELVDDLVIRLRIMRRLYDELLPAGPIWVTEALDEIGTEDSPVVTRTSFRYLQTLYNLGPAPQPKLAVRWSSRLPSGFKRFCAQVSLDTSAVHYEHDVVRAGSGEVEAETAKIADYVPLVVG